MENREAVVRAADRDRVYDLGYLLHNVEEFSWSDGLYLPPDQPWEVSTPCAVLDTGELEEGEEPELARSLGLAYALTVQDVRGIVGNVRELVPQPATAQLLAALKYYVDHDAFIDDESLLRAGAVRGSVTAPCVAGGQQRVGQRVRRSNRGPTDPEDEGL